MASTTLGDGVEGSGVDVDATTTTTTATTAINANAATTLEANATTTTTAGPDANATTTTTSAVDVNATTTTTTVLDLNATTLVDTNATTAYDGNTTTTSWTSTTLPYTTSTTTTARSTTEHVSKITVATEFYYPDSLDNGSGTESPEGFTIPPFLLGIGGGAIVVLVIIVAILGLILRVNMKKRSNKRRKYQKNGTDHPPYLDFRSPSIPSTTRVAPEPGSSAPIASSGNRLSKRYTVPDLIQEPVKPAYPASGQYWASLEKTRLRSPRPMSMCEDTPALKIPRPRPAVEASHHVQGSYLAKPKQTPYSPSYINQTNQQARYERDYLGPPDEMSRIQNTRRMAERF